MRGSESVKPTRKYEENVSGRARGALESFADRLNPPAERNLSDVKHEWCRAVEEARLEWEKARSYFENVSEPDLVDHAVHLLAAAEKKYNYILSQVKHQSAEGG